MPDARLLNRLINYSAAQAASPVGSTAEVTGHCAAAREGAYRFLENPRVRAKDIEEGPFNRTADLCDNTNRILLVQDTTSVAVASNDLREMLKSSGSPTGFLVHSCLAVDDETGEVLGLIDQQRWLRKKRKRSKAQDYADRESAKWCISDMAARERLGDSSQCITVCDRACSGPT